MPKAVRPVVSEVVEHQRRDPSPKAVGRHLEQRDVLEHPGVSADADGEPHEPRNSTQTDAVERVIELISIVPAPAPVEIFDEHQQQKCRTRDQDDVHGADRDIDLTADSASRTRSSPDETAILHHSLAISRSRFRLKMHAGHEPPPSYCEVFAVRGEVRGNPATLGAPTEAKSLDWRAPQGLRP